MCSVWTVCQSMPCKSLVKIGTGAPLPVWQRASSLQRLIAQAGSWFWFLGSYLSQVQAAPGNYFSNLKLPGCFWKVRFDELLRGRIEWKSFWSFPGLLLEGPTHFSRCQIFCIDYDPIFQSFFCHHSQRPHKHVPSSRPAGAVGVAAVFARICS